MKKKKIITIFIIITIILISIIVVINFKKNKKSDEILNKIAEFYQSEFIKETNSKTNGYVHDIYWKFGSEPIEENNSNEDYYNLVIKAISGKEKQNFIIIDEEKNLTIKVLYDEESNKINYIINDDKNYFQNEINKNNAEQMRTSKNSTINLNIKSEELANSIQNNWSRKKTEMYYGNKIKTEDGYDYYSKGIKIKTVGAKIYNLVFEKEYNGYIFDGIKTNMENSDIRNILGNPQYENDEGASIFGYKTDNYYVFFEEGEVSIYRIEKYDEEKSKILGKLIDEYTNDRTKYKEIIKQITDLYPNYDSYTQDENGIDIKYHLLGFEVKMENNEESGFYFYSNYKGYISENLKINEIQNQKLDNIYLIDEDYIVKQEFESL